MAYDPIAKKFKPRSPNEKRLYVIVFTEVARSDGLHYARAIGQTKAFRGTKKQALQRLAASLQELVDAGHEDDRLTGGAYLREER